MTRVDKMIVPLWVAGLAPFAEDNPLSSQAF